MIEAGAHQAPPKVDPAIQARRSAWHPWVPAITFIGTVLILVLRMPESLFRAEFWAEDGLFFSEALADGPSTILEPYAGYFILLVKVVAYLGSLAPPTHAPLVGNAFSIGVMAATAAYATSTRMPWPRRTRVVIALAIVTVPIGFELIGTLVHILWPITIGLALTALSREPASLLGRRLESVGLAVAALTGLGSLLMLPLFLSGPRRRLWIVGPLAILQAVSAVLLIDDRPGSVGAELSAVPYIFLLRAAVTPLIGAGLAVALPTWFVVALGFGIVAIALTLLIGVEMRLKVLLAILLLIIPLAGILLSGEDTGGLLTPWIAPRYFWPASVGFAILIAVNLSKHTGLALALMALFVVGAALEFRIDPASPTGWATKSACVGGPDPCIVPVEPGEKWSVRWEP